MQAGQLASLKHQKSFQLTHLLNQVKKIDKTWTNAIYTLDCCDD
jgi:hypothetical protein